VSEFGAILGVAMAAICIYCGSLAVALGAIGLAFMIVVGEILTR
jgi:hypothetical protein